MKVNENTEQKELRSNARAGNDSANSIRRMGGEDPRRYVAQIAIDRTVRDHEQSGYNHNATAMQPANGGHENEMHMRRQEARADRMGTPMPDGTYRY
jgi:hypothetical protein